MIIIAEVTLNEDEKKEIIKLIKESQTEIQEITSEKTEFKLHSLEDLI